MASFTLEVKGASLLNTAFCNDWFSPIKTPNDLLKPLMGGCWCY